MNLQKFQTHQERWYSDLHSCFLSLLQLKNITEISGFLFFQNPSFKVLPAGKSLQDRFEKVNMNMQSKLENSWNFCTLISL